MKGKYSDWPMRQLGDFFRIKHGFAFKGEFFSSEGEFVLLTPGNFYEGGGIKLKGEKEKYYTGEFSPEFLLNKGDLLIAMTDLTQNAPILGSSAIVPEGGKFLHNQRLGKIIGLRDSEMNLRFLYYLFNTSTVREQIKATATGATVRHTAPERVYQVQVRIPPTIVQRRIAYVLSAYDDLIENNLRRIKILEEMAQFLYKEWFANFRFPGHKKKGTGSSQSGKIPEGWSFRQLGELCELRKDKFTDADSHLPLLDMSRMPQNALAVSEFGLPEELSTSRILFEKGDILFGSIRVYLHKVCIAPCPGVTNVSVFVIRPGSADLAGLLSIVLFSTDAIRWADQHSTGTKMPVIKWDLLEKMPILVPKREVLDSFNSLVKPMLEFIQVASVQNRLLSQTRDLLLPKLISGQLDVSNLDIKVSEDLG